jgi:hypothetical protein
VLSMTAVRITKVERDERGFWTAHVTPEGGDTVTVDNRIGCWTIPAEGHDHGSNKIRRREILPEIARRLWKRVKAAERGEAQDESDVTLTPVSPPAPRKTFRDTEPPRPAPRRNDRSTAQRIAEQMAKAGAAAINQEAA